MSYKITSLYGLPHGHAVAVCLPEVWQYMIEHPEECIDKRGSEYLSLIFDDICHALGAYTPVEAISVFRKMMKEMDLGYPVSSNKDDDLEVLSSSVNPVRLKNNPICIDAASSKRLYSIILY